jgi:hypothetical protein
MYLGVIKHKVIFIVMQATNLMATSSRKQRPSWTKNIQWKKLLSLEVTKMQFIFKTREARR